MLIVIVVAAAVALAAFVASYEKSYLAQQAASRDRSLEDLTVLGVDPVVSTTNPGTYQSVSMVVSSLDPLNTTVTEITVNGIPLAYFQVSKLGTSSTLDVCAICNGTPTFFNIAFNEQVSVSFTTSTWNLMSNPTGGFLEAYTLNYDQFVAFTLITSLGNDFSRAFYPPTAVIQLGETTQYVGGSIGEEDMLVMDGLNSVSPPNATAVWWNWSFSPYPSCLSNDGADTCGWSGPLLGEEVLVPQADFPTCVSPNLSLGCPEEYNITLTVQDSDGLFGTSSIVYFGFLST